MSRPLSWYWHRLRVVRATEAMALLWQLARRQCWRRRKHWPVPARAAPPPDSWHLPEAVIDRNAVLAQAERYLRGEYCMLGCEFSEKPMDWLRDPATGRRAPLVFAFDLDVLDSAQVGNIKTLWEKNRHQHLVVLALAFFLSRDARFAREVAAQLRSWVEQNPFLVGVNWASPLEMGLRLIAWRWIERFLRGDATHTELFGPSGVLWPAIYRQQWLIAACHARGSSANNHLIGEMAGLFVASAGWPVFPQSARWRARAAAMLEREIRRQTFPDGLNREQAFGYHLFTRELFATALAEGREFSDGYRQRLQQMDTATRLLTDVGGNHPRFGDSDDARVLPWSWPAAPQPDAAPSASAALPAAGWYVLAQHRGTAQEIFVLADAGPHGFGPTAAHAHADALAFTLSVGGEPVLVDPGTYDYLDAQWRAYFRGTAAHNTVTVDGRDQSVALGLFLWGRCARVRVLHWEATAGGGGRLVAVHDGYRRWGIEHERDLRLVGHRIIVLDTIRGSGLHEAVVTFHVAPHCSVIAHDPQQWEITCKRQRVRLRLDAALQGAAQPGWYSPAYGRKQQTVTVVGRWRGRLPVTWKCELEVGNED